MQPMKQAVDTAIELDANRWESYCTLGQYYIGLERNWILAEKNYLKSIEINPLFA
jgi:adenylate cyclase